MPCLSLIIAVAIIRVLKIFTSLDIAIKWPNDIVYKNRKLGGVLIEGHYNLRGSFVAVIGIGINFKLSQKTKNNIDASVTDLYELTGSDIDRNLVLGALIDELFIVLGIFERFGFESFISEWREYHDYQGKVVTMILPDSRLIKGEIVDINSDGSLRLNTVAGYQSFQVGEISMRSSK